MARRGGLSLGTKLVLGTVLLVAAAIAVSVWFSLAALKELASSSGNARRQDLEKAISRESTLIARNAAASSALLLSEEGNYSKLEETAARIAAENPSVLWIALVQGDGRVGAATKGAPVAQGDPMDDALYKKVSAAKPGEVQIETDPASADRLVLAAPVFLVDSQGTETRVGTVRMAYDASSLEKAKQEAIAEGAKRASDSARRLLIFAGIIMLVGVLLAGWQSVRIARPLRELSAQARHIAAGDFARRVAVRSGDEIGELGDTFNTMAESLGTMVAEIGRKAGLEREVEVARSIQGLMTPPPDVMTLGSFKLTGRCEMASACGGDWWSYRHLSDGRLLIVVGDVTGHGMPSAMIAATARGAVETLSFLDHRALTPKLVLTAIDRAIRDVGSRQLFMTCFALIMAPNGAVSYANAGHTFPYLMRTSGAAAELSILSVRSNPLGSTTPLISAAETTLSSGDILILTSDGLTDRVSEAGTRFGDKRLRKALVDQVSTGRNDVASICDRIVDEVNAFGGRQPVDDDITLVVTQYTGIASGSGESEKKGVAA
jgi:sigma-B regulation protein RsbU (phosphoserine phosphatase)